MCVAVCRSVLQCVAVCCKGVASVLQSVAVFRTLLPLCCSVLQYFEHGSSLHTCFDTFTHIHTHKHTHTHTRTHTHSLTHTLSLSRTLTHVHTHTHTHFLRVLTLSPVCHDSFIRAPWRIHISVPLFCAVRTCEPLLCEVHTSEPLLRAVRTCAPCQVP